MMTKHTLFTAFLLVVTIVTGGCGLQLADPVLESVEPAVVFNGSDTVIVVQGENFYPKLEISARDGATAPLDEGYTVVLVGPDPADARFQLKGASVLDYQSLQAVVPEGLMVGDYGLIVTGPSGSATTLDNAVKVTDSLAERLEVDVEFVTYEVFDTVWLNIRLKDGSDRVVLDEFPVVVTVESDSDDLSFSFLDGGLVGQTSVGAEQQLTGTLGIDGSALLGLKVETPGLVTITVAPENTRTGVAPGDAKISVQPGSERTLSIELPGPNFETVAGDPFDITVKMADQFGNPVENATDTVLLKNVCNTWVKVVNMQGDTAVEVTLEQATGTTTCLVDSIISVSEPTGQSASIEVVPAATALFDVIATPLTIEAGEMTNLFVSAEDAYGNDVMWSGALSIEDVATGEALQGVSCQAGAPIYCRVPIFVADPGIGLRVIGDDGTEGISNAFSVVASDPDKLQVVTSGNAVAGESFSVSLSLADAWDNVVDATQFAFQEFVFTDPAAEVNCVERAPAIGPQLTLDCTLFSSSGATNLTVELPAFGVTGTSADFSVKNSNLASVEILPSASNVIAGEFVGVDFVGFDEWGNPYVDGPKDFSVFDDSGTISQNTITLGANGTTTENLSFTKAGLTAIHGELSGAVLGTSSSVTVEAAGVADLVVDLDSSWAWVEEDVSVTVQAVDAFGNRASDNSNITLSSASGLGESVSVTLVNGVSTSQYQWESAIWPDRLIASNDAGINGESPVIYVIGSCSASTPEAQLTFGGSTDGVACLDETTGHAEFQASMSASVVSGNTIRYAVIGEDGEVYSVSTNNANMNLELSSLGENPVWGLVAQDDGCGDAVLSRAWVGLDDGSAAGPVPISLSSAVANNGVDVLDLAIDGVTDCNGSFASGALVNLRVNRGELLGATSTGTGHVVSLGSRGDASLQWSAVQDTGEGVGQVYAWTDALTSHGSASCSFEGDNVLPEVWHQDPVGEVLDSVSEVRIRFSEPVDESTVVLDNFSLNGAAPAGVRLDHADEVVVDLGTPVSGSLSVWEVEVSADVTDLAGNPLAGTWAGSAETYLGRFGDFLPNVQAISRCGINENTFRPDGDSGTGVEADFVDIDVESVVAPVWWVFTVINPQGEWVRRHRVAASLNTEVWEWDGRDVTGAVVASGDYQIQVQSMDSAGNSSAACIVQCKVAHAFAGED